MVAYPKGILYLLYEKMKIRDMCDACWTTIDWDNDLYCSQCWQELDNLYEEEREEYKKKEEELWIAEDKYWNAKTQKTEEKWQAIMEKLQDELDGMYEI